MSGWLVTSIVVNFILMAMLIGSIGVSKELRQSIDVYLKNICEDGERIKRLSNGWKKEIEKNTNLKDKIWELRQMEKHDNFQTEFTKTLKQTKAVGMYTVFAVPYQMKNKKWNYKLVHKNGRNLKHHYNNKQNLERMLKKLDRAIIVVKSETKA